MHGRTESLLERQRQLHGIRTPLPVDVVVAIEPTQWGNQEDGVQVAGQVEALRMGTISMCGALSTPPGTPSLGRARGA